MNTFLESNGVEELDDETCSVVCGSGIVLKNAPLDAVLTLVQQFTDIVSRKSHDYDK
ncbi:MAG: hypothetical protein DSM106950_39370 [Stigonema ocellatum SAG 48.90 = DSM 106950]|nr:hypothetical protein [Stigonema ocellatum SAG 48.90 = DSM 106950]